MNLHITRYAVTEIPYMDSVKYFDGFSSSYYGSLLTGRGAGDISGHSFIGLYPHHIIRYRDGHFEIESEKGIEAVDKDFWEFLKDVYESIDFGSYDYPLNRCGAVGYFSYEGFRVIENIKSSKEESYTMPLFEMVIYNRYLVFNDREEKIFQIDIEYDEKSFIDRIHGNSGDHVAVRGIKTECSRDEYLDKINRIIEYILEGDVYEVCLTTEFRAGIEGNPYIIFKNLFLSNPAPFSAYLNFRDITVLCNSPELFIRCIDKDIESRPIKGTAPRGSNSESDIENREKLLSSGKDEAELAMIIDLLRNDIGKVCRTGTVMVADSRRIEAYENVFQLIGIIRGELDEGLNYIDLLRAVFPGGSITGCPKIRSMEIIEELERYRRNIYTGTIFMLNKKFFQSNIVIRTAVVSGETIFFNSGGAITIDSNPADEYDEMIQKVKNIMRVMSWS